MPLGRFSISLAVTDLTKSKAFYEGLGFETVHDMSDIGYCILKHGEHCIGLFQGMFKENILTFNPGWDQNAKPVKQFDDIRELQETFLAAGLDLTKAAKPDGTGPDHVILTDPDGNKVMLDQHVPRRH